MKRLLLASMLFATPAFAQQGPTAEQYVGSLQVTISDSLTQIKSALAQQGQQIATLTKQADADKKQIADLTKDRDALKAKNEPKTTPVTSTP